MKGWRRLDDEKVTDLNKDIVTNAAYILMYGRLKN